MPEVELHAVVHKRVRGPLVWYEGAIRLVEIGGRGRTPVFTFGASQMEDGSFFFVFMEDNIVLCWLYKHAQERAWRITCFLIEFAKQLMDALVNKCDGFTTSHAWRCDAGSDEDVATLDTVTFLAPEKVFF